MSDKSLTRSQLLIMKCIWDYGQDISYQELLETLRTRFERDYHRSTLVTFLQQIEGKGYIETYRVRKFAYVHPVITEEEFKQQHAAEETNFWFGGKASDFLVALYTAGGLPKEDREEIRRLLDGMDD